MRTLLTPPARRLLGTGAALTLMASTATAADLSGHRDIAHWPSAALSPAAFTWTGLYAGIQAGYGWAETDTTTEWGMVGSATETFDYDSRGPLVGLHVGFNRQFDQFVLGIEADAETGGLGGSGIGSVGAVHRTDIEWMGSLRARLGLAVDETLFYVTGGLAWAQVAVEEKASKGLVPYTQETEWQTGWTAGAGIEHAITKDLSVRLEYRYADLGAASYADPSLNLRQTNDITMHTVRAGLSFRF